MSPKSAVLLPLYIYPLPGAWESLHRAILEYPSVSFTIILNPNSGPGATSFPDVNYAREIARLNACPNVCTIGYVRIHYCKKSFTKVCKEVETYAGWAKDYVTSGIAVHGIFFDETPNKYSGGVAAYLNKINQTVKSLPGILGNRLVIHNPGTMPDAGLANPGPDVTTVLEESYAEYQLRSAALKGQLSSVKYDRGRCSFIVHSVPGNEVKSLTYRLRQQGEYIFVTDLCEHYYEQFGSKWIAFIEAMQNE